MLHLHCIRGASSKSAEIKPGNLLRIMPAKGNVPLRSIVERLECIQNSRYEQKQTFKQHWKQSVSWLH